MVYINTLFSVDTRQYILKYMPFYVNIKVPIWESRFPTNSEYIKPEGNLQFHSLSELIHNLWQVLFSNPDFVLIVS